MKRSVFAWFLVLAVANVAATETPAVADGWLRVQGQDIVDEHGNKVLLRGVGLGNWLLPEGYMWLFGEHADRPRRIERLVSDLLGGDAAQRFWTDYRQNYVTETDVQRIAELGFNSVRPALNSRLFLTDEEGLHFRDEGFQLLDQLVAWSRKHGLYVMIDMHGAPGGQTGQNIDDSSRDQPELFMEAKNQDRLVALWVKIAERYRDEPTVAAYDLLNEPLPERTGAAPAYKVQLEPLYRRITAAIRLVDQRHMITIEGADWANDWSVFTQPFDEQLIYQFHYYCWDRPAALRNVDQYLTRREQLNKPVWVGETGEKDNAIYWATTQYFESNNIGWSLWPWKKIDTLNAPYSIKPPDDWEAIRAYARGGDRPTSEIAQRAFSQLLRNIRIENCDVRQDVVNAVLRRVPATIEAENYAHDVAGKGYHVARQENSKYYRTNEPVPVVLIALRDDWHASDQGVELAPGEWTAYVAESVAARKYEAALRVRAEQGPVRLQVLVNEVARDVDVNSRDWHEVRLGAMNFQAGANQIKLSVIHGKAQCDWLRFE